MEVFEVLDPEAVAGTFFLHQPEFNEQTKPVSGCFTATPSESEAKAVLLG